MVVGLVVHINWGYYFNECSNWCSLGVLGQEKAKYFKDSKRLLLYSLLLTSCFSVPILSDLVNCLCINTGGSDDGSTGSRDDGNNTGVVKGAVVGGILGAVILLIVIVIVICCCCRKSDKKS